MGRHPYLKSLIVVRDREVDRPVPGRKDVSDAVAGICQTLLPHAAAARLLTPAAATMYPRDVTRGGILMAVPP